MKRISSLVGSALLAMAPRYCINDESLGFQHEDLVVLAGDNGMNGLNYGKPRNVNDYYGMASQEMVEFLRSSVEIIHKNYVKILISFIQASIMEELQQEDAFYSEPKKCAKTFQNYVFVTRFMQEKEFSGAVKPLRGMESVFSDRRVFVQSVHKANGLKDMEINIHDSWFDPLVSCLPNLISNGFIYLRVSPYTCHKRRRLKNSSERSIEAAHHYFWKKDPPPLEKHLRKFADNKPKSWMKWLSLTEFACNISQEDATKPMKNYMGILPLGRTAPKRNSKEDGYDLRSGRTRGRRQVKKHHRPCGQGLLK